MSAPYLILDNLDVKYPNSDFIVKNFSLPVNQGEFIVILGESGSGKTTILNTIAGFLHPNKGDIIVAGRSIIKAKPGERGIGMVFQGDSLFPHMSVYSNLEFGLKARGVPEAQRRERINQTLQLIQLQNNSASMPDALSSGQKQRVELARLLLRDASLWLLDEPLSNLDPLLKYEIRSEIKKIQREKGITTVYVTHSQSEALTLADRIAIIQNGRLIQYDSPSTIYDDPKTKYAATFIGEPGANLFHASVITEGGKVYLVIKELHIKLVLPPVYSIPCSQLYVGLRPEHCFGGIDKDNAAEISAVVVEKELRGERALAKVCLENREFYVETNRNHINIGTPISLRICLSNLIFFAPDGARINPGATG